MKRVINAGRKLRNDPILKATVYRLCISKKFSAANLFFSLKQALFCETLIALCKRICGGFSIRGSTIENIEILSLKAL